MNLIYLSGVIGDFFDKVTNIIIIALIIAVVIGLIALLMRFEGGRKILKIIGVCIMYIVGVCVVFAGYYCFNQLYSKLTATSYINGSIDIENVMEVDTFEYCTNVIAFNYESMHYIYTIDVAQVTDFNGEKYNYDLIVNDYLLPSECTAGTITTNIYIDFYNNQGDIDCSAAIRLDVKFVNDKTVLTLTTNNYENAQYFERYVSNNGLQIKINKGDML